MIRILAAIDNWLERWPRLSKTIILALILALIAIALSGCERVSDAQRQQLANARAGAQALQTPNLTVDARLGIAEGMEECLLNATNDLELPPPTMTPAQIVSATAAYVHESKSAQPAEGVGGLWLWISGGALLGLRALRYVPGLGGMVANIAYSYIAPKVDKETDRRAHELYQHGAAIVETGSHILDTVRAADPHIADLVQTQLDDLKARISNPAIEQLIAAAKAQAARERGA